MKRYLLLRDNQEKGPFTFDELKDFGLLPNDLIWVDGESVRWIYPSEIGGINNLLKPITPGAEILFKSSTSNVSADVSVAYPNLSSVYVSSKKNLTQQPEQEPANSTLGKSTDHATPINIKGTSIATYGVWITVLIALLSCTVWMFKIIIDVFQGKGLVQSNLTSAVAPLKPLPEGSSPHKEEDAVYQNALSREIVPVDTNLNKEPVKKNPTLKELKRYLKIESNAYKIGVFGGISDLQLTVLNNSSQILEKVILQLDYLKPNGELLQTEKFTFFSIAPHSKKSLEIPPSRRGVKIKYKILDAKPREYKLTLVQA